tara:strand:- start:140 stop:568 length:429 start_codon:yes stop_codon:yes gene_type:complete
MKNIFFILLILFFACEKEGLVSANPEIEFVSISPTTVQEFSEEINITISYLDANGDLGENNPDVKNMFVKDLRNGIEYEYRIPQLSPDNSEIQITGNLEIIINGTGIVGGGISEKVSFEVYVVDREGNQSNVIETDEITINQ